MSSLSTNIRTFVSGFMVLTLLLSQQNLALAFHAESPSNLIHQNNTVYLQKEQPDAPGGYPVDGPISTGAKDTGIAQGLLKSQDFKELDLGELFYTSHVYTHSDIVLFAYEDGSNFEVYRTSGALLWSGILNAGQHQALSPGAGVFFAAGSKPFSINVGDALSSYVWGYYAVDQFGRPLSQLLYTYQSKWTTSDYDPQFIVFAYEDNTSVEIRNTSTNQIVWSGTLNDGEHYRNSQIKDSYLTIQSSHPVAALSYTDQGYYVPASNARFTGKKFHTYVGNAQGWPEDLNLIAYENTSISVTDSATGDPIWFGTLNASQVHSIPNLNNRFISVESSGNIAVSVSPFVSWASGGYYHSIYAQDSSGTGIGTQFIVPAIPANFGITCNLILFSYNDNAYITVENKANAMVWSGNLNQADSQVLFTNFDIYAINSSEEISVLLDCGDEAGAEFAPVHYGVVEVNITSPSNDTFFFGDSFLVTADVSSLGTPLLDARVNGKISLSSGGSVLEFELNDLGLHGDPVAADGSYSARLTLPGAREIQTGNYFLQVNARKDISNETESGSGSVLVTIAGTSQGATNVVSQLVCPHGVDTVVNDICTVRVEVANPDNSIPSMSLVDMNIFAPDGSKISLPLNRINNSTWQVDYKFHTTGRYLIDISAYPDSASPYLAGYGSLVVDVINTEFPLTIQPANLPDTFVQHQLAVITATVSVQQQTVAGATLIATVRPGNKQIDFLSIGSGRYVGLLNAEETGDFEVEFLATSPLYKAGTTKRNFTIVADSTDLLGAVKRLGRFANGNLEQMKGYAEQIAIDGDWFWSRIESDRFRLNFNFLVNSISLGLNISNVGREFEKAAAKSSAPVTSRFGGVNLFSWMRDQADESIDGRIYRSWATRLENSVQSGLFDQYARELRLPPGIGAGVIRRASVYYASELLAESMDTAAQTTFREYLATQRQENPKFLEEELYPIFARRADGDVLLIDEYVQAILTSPPAISTQLKEALVLDLNSRMRANFYLVDDVRYQNTNLWIAQDTREDEENAPWWRQWTLTLWEIGTPIVVGAVWGGPVGAKVGLVIAVANLVGDLVKDSSNLNMDERMQAFAFGSMNSTLEIEDTYVTNALSGLAQIRRGAMPKVPQGEITTIEDFSRGKFAWQFFEKKAVSSITIKNTGDYTASYNVRSYYDRLSKWQTQYEMFWTDSMTDISTGETIGWIELAPGEETTVEIVYKDIEQDNLDMRPSNGDDILFVLTATTLDGGNYYIDSVGHFFEPNAAVIASSFEDANQDYSTFSYPIRSEIQGSLATTDQYIVVISVENPLPFPVSAKIMQTIPTSVMVTSPNGGRLENNSIQWHRSIQPHTTYDFTYVIETNQLDAAVEISPAQLSFYVPQTSEYIDFLSVKLNTSESNSVAPTPPALEINEIYLSDGTVTQEGSWFEIHNTENKPVDVSGMYLSDDSGNRNKYLIPDGLTLAADGYAVFFANNDAASGPEYTNFALNTNGGTVYLYDTSANENRLIDKHTYEGKVNVSQFKCLNYSDIWVTTTNPTPGNPNSATCAVNYLPLVTK